MELPVILLLVDLLLVILLLVILLLVGLLAMDLLAMDPPSQTLITTVLLAGFICLQPMIWAYHFQPCVYL